jgi:hypothetical protein
MSAAQEPGPEPAQGDRPRPDLPLVLLDRWAQLAAERPRRHLAIWAIGIGAANLGLRLLLNDLSLARNTSFAVLTAVGFLAFAWVCTAQLTCSFRRQQPRLGADPIIPRQSCAAGWRARPPEHLSWAGGGPRCQRLWSCPQPVKAPVRRVGRPPGQSAPRSRRLVLAAVGAAITLALLVRFLADLLLG